MKRLRWLFPLALLLAAPAGAQVVRGFASIRLDLRAGPDIGYPVVDVIPDGAPLYVHGCTADWDWCDVSVYDERGWVSGDFIDYPYGQRWVPVAGYGGLIGIPVIRFVIGDYWHDHYRGRDFYRDRDYWYRRRFADRDGFRDHHEDRWHGYGDHDWRERRWRDGDRHHGDPGDGYRRERDPHGDRYRDGEDHGRDAHHEDRPAHPWQHEDGRGRDDRSDHGDRHHDRPRGGYAARRDGGDPRRRLAPTAARAFGPGTVRGHDRGQGGHDRGRRRGEARPQARSHDRHAANRTAHAHHGNRRRHPGRPRQDG